MKNLFEINHNYSLVDTSFLWFLQKGFGAVGGSTVQQILTLRLLIELARDCGRCVYNWVADITPRFFDSVWHEGLWATLQIYGVDRNLLRIIQRLYNFAVTAVKISRKLRLVLADSGLSPLLFLFMLV